MAIFANLENEDAVQINDRTRFNAAKSYVSKGSSPITTMTCQPGLDGSPANIFSTSLNDRYLDWEFQTWNTDIVSSNSKLDFYEGGTLLTATLTGGTYTLAELATEIETQMNSAGSNTYTVTADENDKITIASTGGYNLLPETGENKANQILKHIGFTLDSQSDSVSQTGARVDYLLKQVTVTAGDSAPTTSVSDKLIKLMSVDGDKLFSSDEDLTSHEADILKWVPAGKNTFKNIHRRAQNLILAWLDKEGFVNAYQRKFNKFDICDVSEVKEWSTFMVLRLIFESIHNSKDDVFQDKARAYSSLEMDARSRAILRIDIDGDGKADTFEGINISSGTLYRR